MKVIVKNGNKENESGIKYEKPVQRHRTIRSPSESDGDNSSSVSSDEEYSKENAIPKRVRSKSGAKKKQLRPCSSNTNADLQTLPGTHKRAQSNTKRKSVKPPAQSGSKDFPLAKP
jgi:hypothetical protein